MNWFTTQNTAENENVLIQRQDYNGGNWATMTVLTVNRPFVIQCEMENIKRNYPNQKVRAVDSNGRLLDML